MAPVRFWFLSVFMSVLVASCGPTPHPKQPELAELYERAPRGPLPSGVRPTAVAMDLLIDPHRTRFGGIVEMQVQLDRPATGIWLHGQSLEIRDVRISGEHADNEEGSWRDVLSSGVAWIGFPRRMGPGEITVRIDYAAQFDDNLSGLFRVEEQGDFYALAKSESIQARRFMPGFDEPRFKAPYNIILTVPESDTVISNAPERSREPVRAGYDRVIFERTRPLPTYLLSISVGPFDRLEAQPLRSNEIRSKAVPLNGYTRRGKGEDIGYAIAMTEPMVEFFEEALGVPYPYKKLDIVAAPQWPSGATELAAAITYRESRILFGATSGPSARRSLLNIHSHEIAHMWFGDLVTPPWWDDLWLKEAFASWATGIVLSDLEPDGGFELDAISDALSAMSLDSLESARAVREPITLNEDIRNAYDSITYDKGFAVIAMVDSYFGPETFRPALGRYIERFEDSVADSRDFFDVIGRETNEPDLTRAFRSFVEQSGLPRLDVELNCVEGERPSIEVRQSRYKPLGSPITEDRRWTIPFCAVASREGKRNRRCQMITSRTVTLPLRGDETCPDWILPNAGGQGYWRFNMATEQWALLAVHFAELSASEAMVAIDSAVAAFKAGDTQLGAVMAVVNAGARRPERQVVIESMVAYSMLSQFVRSDPEASEGYNAEVQRVFRPLLDLLAERTDENGRILRTRVQSFLARTGRDEEVRKSFADAARAYIGLSVDGPVRELTSDDFSSSLAIAVQDGGRPVYEALLSAMDEFDDPSFEQAAAYAIGQNVDPELTPEILDLALSGGVGTRETYSIVAGQMDRSETQALTWSWLQMNFPEFVRAIPGQRPRSTPRLASELCYSGGARELEGLYQRYGELAPGHERALAEALENISLCIALRQAKGDEVRRYFAALVPADEPEEVEGLPDQDAATTPEETR